MTLDDHRGMLTEHLRHRIDDASTRSLSRVDSKKSPLQRVVETGLLHCGVPAHFGGNGGALDDLAAGARTLRHTDAAAARVLWAQRLAIETLVQSRNVCLGELWLPDLLTGVRAGTLALWGVPLTGFDTGRGWLLAGRFDRLPNLLGEDFSLVAPVRLGDEAHHWVLLRSEEDGLSIEHPEGSSPAASGEGLASLRLHQVFFREDEWLSGPELPERLGPVATALAACHPEYTP